TSPRSSSSYSSTGFASILSAASGYWRIWASAMRLLASASASSSSSRTCPSIFSSSSDMHAADYPFLDPREPKANMSQGARRHETPRDREERSVLEPDLAESPVTGKPLESRPRNFRPDADAAIRALGGPTAWMRRLRAIEDEVDRHGRQLEE